MSETSAPGTVRPEIPRDHWGRPLVMPPGGGKRVPYTRCTTYVGSIEDRYALGQWQQRMVALGLVDRRDLRLAAAASRHDKGKLNEVCEQALDAAQGKAAATTGTALHALTEQLDRGESPIIPDEVAGHMAAYEQATAELKAVAIEQFSVQDTLKVAGTPDRQVLYRGTKYIADLKTGSIDYGALKIASQLSMYARSVPYDVATDQRLEHHGCNLERGIVIHLPAAELDANGQPVAPYCRLYWVDLLAGWEAVKVCRDVRAQRQLKFGQLMRELVPVPGAPLTLAEQITASATRDQVTALWRTHAPEWTEELTELARRHVAALPA